MAEWTAPAGYAGATPYLSVRNADAAIAWYQRALGAELVYRMEWQDKVGHAELRMSGGHVMLAEEFPDLGLAGPESRGGTTVSMLLYVPDVEAAHARVMAEGATEFQPLADQPWGDRSFQMTDPFGHRWTIATKVEDVSWDELDKRIASEPPAP
ncbi:MAG: VOC family protein [Thermaurantiacus sp.]